MSQPVADLLDSFRRVAPADQKAAISALLSAYLIGHRNETLTVPGGADPLGLFVPYPLTGEPPVPTPAEEAELDDRMKHLDDSLPLSDYIASLGRPETPAPR